MLAFASLRWRHVVFGLILLALPAALGAVLFAWSGLYSVAASKGHWPFVAKFLDFAMRSSVRTHAFGINAPPLDDPALVMRGAAHYHGGCRPCHGAPGERQDPIVLQMLPPPPDLEPHIPSWTSAQLFWIVKSGLKYTGMPAWPATGRDDEVWAVTAFLKRLPDLDATAYRELARGEQPERLEQRSDDGGRLLALAGPLGRSVAACARCHDLAGGGRNAVFPRIGGQSAAYLAAALQSYADGTRPSGIMAPVAADLSTSELQEVANYYARQSPPPGPKPEAAPQLVADGRAIALTGASDKGLPACSACHDAPSRNPLFPSLAGQSANYIVQQLRLWRDGVRGTSATSRIMEPIARSMTDDQIRAVAAYYASQDPTQASSGPSQHTPLR